jgi:hypothetical protein
MVMVMTMMRARRSAAARFIRHRREWGLTEEWRKGDEVRCGCGGGGATAIFVFDHPPRKQGILHSPLLG